MLFTKFQDDDCDKLRGCTFRCMYVVAQKSSSWGVVVGQDVRIQFMTRHQVVKCYINIIQALR